MSFSTPPAGLTLQDIGEFGLIERIQSLLPPPPPSLLVGIGDDTAIWQPSPGKAITLTCDCAVEGHHFPSLLEQNLEFAQCMGRRAAHMNLSDIAAMAATPKFAMVGLAIPSTHTVDTIEALYQGMISAFQSNKVTVVGGNITSTTGPLLIHISMGGEITPDQAALRTGANAGERIGVTGTPGSSANGLRHWLNGTSHKTVEAYLKPTARVQEGLCLGPYVTAMTDISDGLLLDLQNLLTPKQLGAELTQTYDFSPSDDYELIFTAPLEVLPHLENEYQKLHQAPPIQWIGTTTSTPGITLSGQTLAPQGWVHFQTS